jgi:hypothetical protein
MIFIADLAPIGKEIEKGEVGERWECVDEVSSWSSDI